MERLLRLGSLKQRDLQENLKNTKIIMDHDNTRELHVAAIEQKLHNWKLPKIANSKIYETSLGFSNLFTHDYIIETTEKSLPVNPEVEQIELIDANK